MGKLIGRRCSVKFKLVLLVLFVFVSIHMRDFLSLDKDDNLTIPEELFPKFVSRVKFEGSSEKLNAKRNLLRSCDSKRGVVFLKTHKTASTTMTNVFLRYAGKHKLAVGLPPPRKWELAGYPSLFNENLIDPQLKQYEMLCHHFRMTDKETILKFVPDDALFITIIRDPANAFESGFSFFRDYPFAIWLANYEKQESLKTFLENPTKYYNTSTPWYFRAKNYQAFDLGFDHERDDDVYFDYVLQTMDNSFDFVMITELLDESLILLKELLCMEDLDEIMYIKLKVRQDSLRRPSDDRMRKQMRQWNSLDYAIHQHFLKRLERKIMAYGKRRMQAEVNELRRRAESIEEKCVLEYDHENLRPWISRIRLKRGADKFCQMLTWGEVKFGDYIRSLQKQYIKIPTEDQIPPDNMKRMLYHEQNKILHI